MQRIGVMQDIKEHLARGESAQALIQQGYKSGSVYKVQWQMRKKGELNGKGPRSSVGPGANRRSTEDPGLDQDGNSTERVATLEAENADLTSEVARLRHQVEEADSLRSEVDRLQVGFEYLENKVDCIEADIKKDKASQITQTNDLEQRVSKAEKSIVELTRLLDAACVLVGALHFGHKSVNIDMAHQRGDFARLFGSVPTKKAEEAESLLRGLLEREVGVAMTQGL